MALEKKEKKKRRKSDADAVVEPAGDEAMSGISVADLEMAEEQKKSKTKRARRGETATAEQTSGADDDVVKKALPVISTEEKKKKKKRKQLPERLEDVTAAASTANQGAAIEDSAADNVGIGDGTGDLMDGDAAAMKGAREEVVDVENGTVAGEGLSVREKKGKGKKSQRDRWGQKLVDDTESPGTPAVAAEAQPMSNGSSDDVYDLKKVFVGGMPYYITEDDIHDYFSECGVISEMDCMTFPDSGNFRGIAFLTFATGAGATKSLEYDGSDMGGRYLKIERCKLRPRTSASNPDLGEVQKTPGLLSVYIGNLSWDVDEESIRKFLKKSYSATKIESIRFSCDKNTGDFKGFGHIDFGDDESLEAAVKLNQTNLLGRPVKIAYAVALKQGNRNGSGNENNRTEERRPGSCYNCGEEGHKSFLCPTKGAAGNRKPDSVKVGACYSCGKHGHKSFACPTKGSD